MPRADKASKNDILLLKFETLLRVKRKYVLFKFLEHY